MDIPMPKQLKLSLINLFDDFGLTGWTIHGSDNSTTVILRFKMEDHIDDHIESSKDHIKYKRVSPSQIARDEQRAKLFKSSKVRDTCDSDQENDADKTPSTHDQTKRNMDSNIDINDVGQHSKQPAHVRPKVFSPRRINTRSRTQASVQHNTSPIPQVDGQVESKPYERTICDPSDVKDPQWYIDAKAKFIASQCMGSKADT